MGKYILGAVGALALFFGVVYLGGQTPPDCSEPRAAMLAADEFNQKVLLDPSEYERTGVTIDHLDDGVEVGLIYSVNGNEGQARAYRVSPDCSVAFVD